MRILIISRSFAPDSGIATIRPTKMAKYLSKLGHNVVVIRSGLINGKGDVRNLSGLENVKIYSYEGVNCAAERIERGETVDNLKLHSRRTKNGQRKKRFGILKKIVLLIYDPIMYYKNEGKRIKDKIINLYDNNQEIRNFDVIISTFNPLGAIQAGYVLKKKEACKWIIDFRDLMDNMTLSPLLRKINTLLQNKYCKACDACLCVSEGNSLLLKHKSMIKRKNDVYTLYNGFDSSEKPEMHDRSIWNDGKMHICYTGTMHGGQRDCTPLFRAIKENKLQESIIIDYAGKDGNEIIRQAKKVGVDYIIHDHGYLSRADVAILQSKCDIFLVISWNTKTDQGILTGKFYEALMHRKPIIAMVSGNMPDSELKRLIDRYNLGICYEESADMKTYEEMRNYLVRQYNHICMKEEVEYKPDETVFKTFDYYNIVKELEKILIQYTFEEKRT